MKDRYDIIVVGGGPGGAWAAKHAAEKGASVLLLEKDRDIGIPVRCAEGVSEKGFGSVIQINEKWIAQVIKGAFLVAPDGTKVESYTDERGFVLHRKLLDADLVSMAAQAGAEVVTRAYVYDLVIEDNTVKGIYVSYLGRDYKVFAHIVIGADGVESRVGRWAGLDTRLHPKDIASCVQMTLTGINIDPEFVQFYFGQYVAPMGYLWIFPKGSNTANVGLGIPGGSAKNKKPLVYLQEFIMKNFPDASNITTMAGSVPISPALEKIVVNGLLLVGDAAHQSNPLSGGGIVNAMIAGKLAAETAVEAIHKGDVSEKRLSGYPRKWKKAEGNNNARSYKIKKTVSRFSDEDFNKTAKMLLQIPQKERTGFRVFKAALIKHPKLIFEAAKIFV
jgi:digeranylgeranylglycerophospholipid reductase